MASSAEDLDSCTVKPDASQIYLLTGKNYRISRSIKVSWFLDNFNKVITANSDDVIKSSSEELKVLSVLSKPTSEHSETCVVVPSTLITFLARIYKFVFCLDASQSLASVDILSGKIVNELSFESFQNCMRGLVLPFTVPGCSALLPLELHVTVLGYNGILDCGTVQVLVEGCLVTQDNVESFLSSVYEQLQQMENKNASVLQAINNKKSDGKQTHYHVTSELSIVSMLRMSILALELLPSTASGGIVVISDGVFGLPNAAVVHKLLAELRCYTVCCSFVKVGSPSQAHCSFGYIPNIDLMKFLANATSGAFFSNAPPVNELECGSESGVNNDVPQMNFYHKSFLCWSFQWEYDLSKINSWEDEQRLTADVPDERCKILSSHQWDKALTEQLIRKELSGKTLRTAISNVLSIRLREGYCVKDIAFVEGGKELVVKLLLLVKQNAYIEYTATASWPVPLSNAQTKIKIDVLGTYGFLCDVFPKQIYSMKPYTVRLSYRANVVETFKGTLKNLEMTDELLVKLQSFSSTPLYYSTPECVRRGVPLFYFPPNSSQPELVVEQGKSKSSKSQEAQFAAFWKTILTLDVSIWQRWMHCHRINMVLEHDRPLPKSLFLPSPNDRFYHIQCRNSISSLAAFLKQWSSFVLSESHSYIKFVLSGNADDPPRSFCIVHISPKASCVVIRIAFLGGTPGEKRHEIVNSLRDDLKKIKAQFAPSGKSAKSSHMENELEKDGEIQEQLVCTKLLHKPLDRILVRYDEQPKEFLVRSSHFQQSSGIIETYEPWMMMHRAKRAPESPLKVLSRFLYHHRWVFTLHPTPTDTANTVSKILRYLTKKREDQGYRFVASNLGVTTMFKEFWVKESSEHNNQQTTCIVQFVMFPPLTSSGHNRVAGWALDNGLPEDERELELVLEIWVEPQHGVIAENENPEYLVGTQYFEIPAKIFEADLEAISTWLTFDHICRMCDDRVVNSPQQAVVHVKSPPNDPDRKSLIYEVPFPFDVMKVLGYSRQAELWFATLIEHERVSSRSTNRRSNDILFSYILEHMERLNDRELTLTSEDSQIFLDFCLQRVGLGKSKQDGSVTWRCFTRMENNHLLLTFVPSSFQSLQAFARIVKELESYDEQSTESTASVMHRKRQASAFNMELDSTDQQEKPDDDNSKTVGKFWRNRRSSQRRCVDLSVFVYDFSLSSLTEIDTGTSLKDILLDYRNRLERFEQNASLEKSKELRFHCIAIYELFLYCFVSTVFESLQRGENVDDDNVDEILAICSDHIPEEIDLFGFLGNICGHIKHPTNTGSVCSSEESLQDWKCTHEENAINFLRSNCDVTSTKEFWPRCEELYGLHDYIQQRFHLVLQKYFSPIPNRKDHYFYLPISRQDPYQSDKGESDEESIETSSDNGSDVVFERDDSVLISMDASESENAKSAADTNTMDDITEGSVNTWDDLASDEEDLSDYPSNRSDIQSSTKEDNIMEQSEEEHNVPLFLNLNCTIRDRSHLSSTMVSMPAEYLPVCFADILDQANRDPDQIVDPSISSLQVTLDLICLVPPREPDYSRWKSRSRYKTRSSSVSSVSSDSPQERIVRFENVDGAVKSISVTASHDRESSLLVSGLPLTQIESICAIRDDINWLLHDEIVFSLCHVPDVSLSILHSVTEHIIQSHDENKPSSRCTSMQLDFVLDQSKGLAIFMQELDKIRIDHNRLSKLGDYHYLRLSSSPSSTSLEPAEQCKTEHEKSRIDDGKNYEDGMFENGKSRMDEEKNLEDEMFIVASLLSDEGNFPQEGRINMSSGHQFPAGDSFTEVWLILRKSDENVLEVFFHARDSCDDKHHDLYAMAINEIKDLCHLVNQKMLLRYMHDNKMCHPLLQPRSEADIWNESVSYSSPARSFLRRVDGRQFLHQYLYEPGHFRCPAKWTACLPIHFRLRGNSNRNNGADRAKQALQTVLSNHSLNEHQSERSSMYVYQEKNGNIFYFNLDSSLCLSKEDQLEGTKYYNYDADEYISSPPLSPVSSFQSYPKTAGTADLEDDLEEYSRKRSAGVTTDTISINGSAVQPVSEHVEECIKLTVHGVTEPSDEIKKDLVNVLQKRLDDYTLEILSMSLARNPKTKLALQDVQFIQPTGSAPLQFIQMVLPSFAEKNLHPFSFFFKQHLLNYVHAPKYTTQKKKDHFKKYTSVGDPETLPESDVFIFTKTGAQGVACLAVSISDSHGNTLQVNPQQKAIGLLDLETTYNMEELTKVVTVENSNSLQDNTMLVEISIWERGDVGMEQLKERLKKSVRHALCDILVEYYLLTASFSCIPNQYLKPSSRDARYKKINAPKTLTVVTTHRRTPSAGSIGCGRTYSPKPEPRAFRSQSSSPVRNGPSSPSVFKIRTPEIITTSPITDPMEIPGDDYNKNNSQVGGIINDPADSKNSLTNSSDQTCKQRSHSEGKIGNMRSANFRPISRSYSTPTPPVIEKQNTGEEPKSGRFSPYETFTENELTESREFGEEAVRANDRNVSGKNRNKTSEYDGDPKMKERDAAEERRKYENGEKGKLHPSFEGPAQELMKFAKDLETPSIHVQRETLQTRYSVDAILYELMSLVKNLCPDLNSRVYRAAPCNSKSLCDSQNPQNMEYVLYDPIRPPLQAKDDQETSVDQSGSYIATSAKSAGSFLFISRNVVQWRYNLQKLQDLSQMEPDLEVAYKEYYPSQQFQSWNDASERSKDSSAAFSNCFPGFVSRQRLILIDVRDKEIIATTYNMSSEVNSQFSLRLTNLVNWNNARCHLVSCLFQQKMGLFHHSNFQGLNAKNKELNPFCDTSNDHHLFSLLKQTAPTSPDKSSGSKKQIPSVAKLLFEETLRDVVPPRPLQTTKHCTYRDPVKRHGAQFQEIRAIQIRKAVQNAELQKLFASCLCHEGFNISTVDSSINLLKRQSRLVHCCKTPFLFCDEWISSVGEKPSLDQQGVGNRNEQEPNVAVKEDKWHYKLREEFINFYKQFLQQFALVQLTVQPTKVSRKSTKPTRKKAVSERGKLVSDIGGDTNEKKLHYYLQKTIDGSKDTEKYAYDGGIMLVELAYEGCHFCVKLYVFESSRLLSSDNFNQQEKASFLAECSKVRDLTHLNSFSYDFHLRHVQHFLMEKRPKGFPKGFKLTSMLSNLMNVFIYPPKFSWNHICKGQLSLPLPNLSRETVYNYIVEHCSRYNLSTVEMNSQDDKEEHVLVSSSQDKKQGHVLAFSSQDKYDVSLLAKLNLDGEEGQLGLKFYVVKTNHREIFPKMNQEYSRRKQSSGFIGDTGMRLRQTLGPGQSNSPEREPSLWSHGPGAYNENIKRSSSSPQFITALPLSQSPSEELLRHLPSSPESRETTHLPSSLTSHNISNSQTSLSRDRPYIVTGLEPDPSDSLMAWDLRHLGKDADKCYRKLHEAVSSAQKDCLRDHLWHLMLKGATSDESGSESQVWKPKSRRKTEYRRVFSDFTDAWTVPSSLQAVEDGPNMMSFEDFERLLELVKPSSLPVVDEILKPFISMDIAWYSSLWSTLLLKFGDTSREFSRSDTKVHYLVLLNPKNLDMFILITINEEKHHSDVKIVNRINADENKKSDRVLLAKSSDDFIAKVVNALCYQMWTGLLL
ncbi:KICSTOR complex protein SZT2-like [Dendronephthya gigantea]|uniref:KICSTOR complex protein SZT2-like n=1 Tax=Dendronephthya gigantea TaxID=151771 RepID=UPI00106BEE4E|nr:KICSTOR complex protein SZT2-like [Dendronephthya gigantea]